MAADKYTAWDRLGELVLRVAIPVVSLIPRRAGLKLGELIGRAIYLIDARHRRTARTQIAACLGEEQARLLAPRVFENLGRLIMEMFYMRRLSPAEVARRVRFEGLDHLWEALAKGRGCLLLTAHTGAFELMPSAFSLAFGRRVNAVVRRMDWEPAHRTLVRLRERFGNRSILKGRAMRPILRLLESGEVVAVLPDQNVAAREGVFVDFFGRPACTNRGMAQMALRFDTPVVPAFIRYEGAGRHVIEVQPGVRLTRSGDFPRDVLANTALFTQVVEGWVRRYPGEWFWMHRRWKTRPPEEASGDGGTGCCGGGSGKEAGGACSKAA